MAQIWLGLLSGWETRAKHSHDMMGILPRYASSRMTWLPANDSPIVETNASLLAQICGI